MAKKVVTQKENNGIVSATMSHSFEGPLPPPADLKAYKEVLPSAPERIMVMAEDEQDYRHKISHKVVNYGLVESILGMCFAFIIVLLYLAAAFYLAMHGHEGVAIALIGIIAALAAIFYLKKEPSSK